ncbi:hypothetical protein ASPU41_16350 [Arthrobacter sp. U41]|nr:hypothetical protein ASPU41_16350 [Arthrobacter sp. U41]
MVQARAKDTFPGRVSSPRVLFDCGGLFGQGVIDAAEHPQIVVRPAGCSSATRTERSGWAWSGRLRR